jgi:hypothetical protein
MIWNLSDFRSFWHSPARYRWARVFCKPRALTETASLAAVIRNSPTMALSLAQDLTNFGDVR